MNREDIINTVGKIVVSGMNLAFGISNIVKENRNATNTAKIIEIPTTATSVKKNKNRK